MPGFERVSAALSFRQIGFAALLVAVVSGILGVCQLLIGPNTATSGYLTILLLLSTVRTSNWRVRLFATMWSVAVAVLGFVLGGLGIWVTLAALVVVSIVQGFVTLGEGAFLTRSPVNLLAFGALSQSAGEVWHVLLGCAIGAGVIWVIASITRNRKHEPEAHESIAERIGYGLATAAGSLLIVIVADLIGFPHVAWALLSFSIILSVGSDQRSSRSYLRVWGSVVGVIVSVLIGFLPAPIPMIAAVVCAVLCVAYINAGNYALFVLFLTPAVLLTTVSEHSFFVVGVYRLEAVLFATAVALICSFILQKAIQPKMTGGDVSIG